MERIGIFGGTFDPIHYGHLILADQARYDVKLSKVVFMPANLSPFKLHREIADGAHRYEMVKLAIAGNPYFDVSDLELGKREVSYTIQTLRACRRDYGPDCELCFITGTDAFLGVERWADADELLTDYSFIVGSRPGYREDALDQLIRELREKRGTRVYKVHMTEVDISSTDIKHKLRAGRPIRYLLPEAVEAYLREKELYQTERNCLGTCKK